MIHQIMNRRLAVVSGLVILNAFGLASVARAGEGGIAGSAAFTVNGTNVTGVAVSAAVGKQSAAAHAFNYNGTNSNGLLNSAFAIGSGGVVAFTTLGSATGFNMTQTTDPELGTAQLNTISKGSTIRIGTGTGNEVYQSPQTP